MEQPDMRLMEPARLVLNPTTTPLLPAPQLSQALGGPQIWIKRDDLIPFGCGGNKIRGLELIVADALKAGADTLVTGAGVLSNHVRATAAAAAFCGLGMTAVYWGDPPRQTRGNHLLSVLWGAQTRFTGSSDRNSVDGMLEVEAADIRAAGGRPYVIPRGGACALGVIGHVQAVGEVMAQCRQAGIRPDYVVMAVGSGGTLAGWLLGSRLLGASWRVEGITVSRPAAEARVRVKDLADQAADHLGLGRAVPADDVIIHDGFIGAGYGIASPAGMSALERAARCEGVVLDPVYTGKAMAGYGALVGAGRYGEAATVLFLHSGGLPSLFVDGTA
ncbi:1-aminocyclopropane-1-carboxylate deaminase (plasmid) [Xanthobacter versatilis]|uniref:1-aminocyclopropane-1-carboxylate deaminase n=1 Tax=Xanthobacter autotrophicus (strain ATCC BAA-1158 / Py2) TaxID=78245 RepID=A7IPY8_XANP2|nr:1-aminocyclopropane-1-carboxylate deaminase [Xanthobacter autotrophicus Py2]